MRGALSRVGARRGMILRFADLDVGGCHGEERFGDCCDRILGIWHNWEFSECRSGGTIVWWVCWVGVRQTAVVRSRPGLLSVPVGRRVRQALAKMSPNLRTGLRL